MQYRTALSMLFAAVVLGPYHLAYADTVMTPAGPADRSCVHAIPQGSRVDIERGNVVDKGGTVIAHYGPCQAPSAATVPVPSNTSVPPLPANGPVQVPTGGGWYDYSWANATTISGMTQFNYMNVDWSVPANPSNTTDTGLTYYFNSLESINSSGQWVSIIQPVMSWGYNGLYGGHYWTIAAWEADNTGGYYYYGGGANEVRVGDVIEGVITQYSNSPVAWEIDITDVQTGYAWTNDFVPVSTWPPYNSAQMGVLEGYGSSTGGNLNSCADLSTSNSITFYLNQLDEAGPNWNANNSVLSSLTWTGYVGSQGPSCSWGHSISTVTDTTQLSWVY